MTSKSILLLLFLSGPLFGGSGKKKQNKESEPNNPTKAEDPARHSPAKSEGSAWHSLDDIFEVYIWREKKYQPLKNVALGYEGHVTGLLETLLSDSIDIKEGLPSTSKLHEREKGIHLHQ